MVWYIIFIIFMWYISFLLFLAIFLYTFLSSQKLYKGIIDWKWCTWRILSMKGASPSMMNEPHCGPIEFQKCFMIFSYRLEVLCFVLCCFVFYIFMGGLTTTARPSKTIASCLDCWIVEINHQIKGKGGVSWLHNIVFLGVFLVTIGVDVGHDVHSSWLTCCGLTCLWIRAVIIEQMPLTTNCITTRWPNLKNFDCFEVVWTNV